MTRIFQYGSNMRQSRLNAANRLNGRAKRIGAAWTTERYRLLFPVYSKSNACAAAGILPYPTGVRLFGAIYDLAPDDVLLLDRIEGSNYLREPLTVELLDGEVLKAETYFPIRQSCDSPSNIKYCSNILLGLGELNAPDTYVDYVVDRIAEALG